MTPHSNHQNQALTILAIATAAIGFGLFGAEFSTGQILFEPGLSGILARTKLGCGSMALVSYATVLASVAVIVMQDDNVTGRNVAEGPILLMSIEMTFVALILIIGVFEEPATN